MVSSSQSRSCCVAPVRYPRTGRLVIEDLTEDAGAAFLAAVES